MLVLAVAVEIYQEVQKATSRIRRRKSGMKLTFARSARTCSGRAEVTKLGGTLLGGMEMSPRATRCLLVVALERPSPG